MTDIIKCRECGKPITKLRRNQIMCSAECRTSYERRIANRNYKEVVTKECEVCDTPFERSHPDQKFCSDQCRNFYNNFFKKVGRQLYEGMAAWRVGRKKGSMTKATQAFSDARSTFKDACKEFKKKKEATL